MCKPEEEKTNGQRCKLILTFPKYVKGRMNTTFNIKHILCGQDRVKLVKNRQDNFFETPTYVNVKLCSGGNFS